MSRWSLDVLFQHFRLSQIRLEPGADYDVLMVSPRALFVRHETERGTGLEGRPDPVGRTGGDAKPRVSCVVGISETSKVVFPEELLDFILRQSVVEIARAKPLDTPWTVRRED